MKSKEQKRTEAIERQAKYDSLSIEEKIKLVKSRRGNSKKELDRLQARWIIKIKTKNK